MRRALTAWLGLWHAMPWAGKAYLIAVAVAALAFPAWLCYAVFMSRP